MIEYISAEDYFGKWITHQDATDTVKYSAMVFLAKVNSLLNVAVNDGVHLRINEKTHSYISGQTLGGFRPRDCGQGAPKSSHKEGRGVDIYDPQEDLDDWCIAHPQELRDHGLYLEHPSATQGWCHLSDRMPASGNTVFMP